MGNQRSAASSIAVLLANPGSHQLIRWEQPLRREDHTDDTPAFPVGNYVNAALGNYVNENLVNLGNYLNADTLSLS